MKKLPLVFALALFASPAFAQAPRAVSSSPGSLKITTGNTYQQILPAVTGSPGRGSLTIQNNNTTDNCLIDPTGTVAAGNTTAATVTINGVTLTSAQASILLLPGGSYTRYWPYTPKDKITGTCATTGDSLYVDTQ